jgi:hypothetical protein
MNPLRPCSGRDRPKVCGGAPRLQSSGEVRAGFRAEGILPNDSGDEVLSTGRGAKRVLPGYRGVAFSGTSPAHPSSVMFRLTSPTLEFSRGKDIAIKRRRRALETFVPLEQSSVLEG